MDSELVKEQIIQLKGIKQVKLLDSEQREFIEHLELEEEKDSKKTDHPIENKGIKEVLKRQIVFVATHDKYFREADHPLTKKERKKTIILSTPFNELEENDLDAIIASPSKETHEYLEAFIEIQKDDATLLIGI
jgi:hypothetical protein